VIRFKLKIPLVVLGVIGFLAALIAFSRYQGQRELKAAQDYAQTQGWGFSREAAEDFKTEVAEILADLKFELYYIRTVETGWRNLYLFDCSYNNRDASARSNHDSYGTACLVLSNRFRDAVVPVEIITRDWTEVMQPDKWNGQIPVWEEISCPIQGPWLGEEDLQREHPGYPP
jgi:hypothetical protein